MRSQFAALSSPRNCRRGKPLVSLILLLLSASAAVAQLSIDWELVNPFPFIRKEQYVDDIRREFAKLPGRKTALELERALQRRHELAVEAQRDADMRACPPGNSAEAQKCRDAAMHPFLGWFAEVGAEDHAATCWDSSKLEFRKSCGDFFNPSSHRVRAWITADTPASLVWSSDDPSVKIVEGSCGPADGRFQCVEFELPYNPRRALSLRAAAGAVSLRTEVFVEDKIVAGLGDSYASGEGNPDVPAQFLNKQSDVDLAWFWKWRRSPRKDRLRHREIGKMISETRDVEVRWLDKRCHRSMYSYQFKTALHLALQNPKQSIRYVSFACSGGETKNVIGTIQSPKEYFRNGTTNIIEPQLKALRAVLKSREVDYLLLSIGGNDIGFPAYMANIILSGKTRLIAKAAGQAKKASAKKAVDEMALLRENYLKLNAALFDPYRGIAIAGCTAGSPCNRIILTAYPNFARSEEGKPCTNLRDEFNIPFNRDGTRRHRTKRILKHLEPRLREFQLQAPSIRDANGQPLGWTVASRHLDEYEKSGYCSQADVTDTDQNWINENFMLPQRNKWRWRAWNWRTRAFAETEPRNYKPYGTRSRWIRLPIDSKMTTDQQVRFLGVSLDFLFLDERSTVMHPTAEGFAAHADGNLDAIRNLPMR